MPCGADWQSQLNRAVIVLYADCEVYYDGRASSRANRAWRLIIIKPDGSLLIHTSEGYQPLNWQPPGSRVTILQSQQGGLELVAIRRRPREMVRIRIYEVEWACWGGLPSEGRFELRGTHDDLKLYIANNIGKYLPGGRVIGIEYEVPGFGIADIIATTPPDGAKWVIEVKRQCADLQAISQLKRYTEALKAKGLLVAPCFTSGARELARKYGFKLVEEAPPPS